MYVNVNGTELPVYQYVDTYDNKEKWCRPSSFSDRLTVTVDVATSGVYTRYEDMETETSMRGIIETGEMLEALCLKEMPTVDNWKKTKMSKYVAKYVNNRDLPPTLSSIIKEECPEWFI